MSVGIIVPLPAYTLNPAFIAKKAEDLGFESIWYHEHPILPVKSESPFPINRRRNPVDLRSLLGALYLSGHAAAVTSKIKLATGITLVPERNPLILAKEILGPRPSQSREVYIRSWRRLEPRRDYHDGR